MTTTPAKKTYIVTKSDRSTVEVQGTKLVEDPASSKLKVYDGEELVGSFINTDSVHVKAAD